MRMTPEQIRTVFIEAANDEHRLVHAIRAARAELDWHRTAKGKAKSPYSINKLTEGLPNRDRIIELALREAKLDKMFRTVTVVVHKKFERSMLHRPLRLPLHKRLWFALTGRR